MPDAYTDGVLGGVEGSIEVDNPRGRPPGALLYLTLRQRSMVVRMSGHSPVMMRQRDQKSSFGKASVPLKHSRSQTKGKYFSISIMILDGDTYGDVHTQGLEWFSSGPRNSDWEDVASST